MAAPSPPRAVKIFVLTPTTVKVQWLPPIQFNDHTISYEIHWSTAGTVAGIRQKGEQIVGGHSMARNSKEDTHSAMLDMLLPGQNYSITVRAYSQSSGKFSQSEPQGVRTFPEPEDIKLINKSAYAITVGWSPSSDTKLIGFEVLCEEISSRIKHHISNNSQMVYSFLNLLPKHQYILSLKLFYPLSPEAYIWPPNDRFMFETHGDRPSPPGIPVVQHLRRDIYQVTWEPSNDNGAHLEIYSLEGHIQGDGRRRRETVSLTGNTENHTLEQDVELVHEWQSFYNGTDNYWIISDLSPSSKYVFRVRSKNTYGWSEFSAPSESFDFTEAAMLAKEQELTVVLGISIPVGILIICILGMLTFLYAIRRRKKEKKIPTNTVTGSSPRGPDVELATLRELPRRGNFISQSNALYTVTPDNLPGDAELALLPHIRRDQITLTKFLGSGAFGEVFEGIARNLIGMGDTDTRVAIKTLRKGATEQEKAEFLKEAQLMSNFKHEHILQLLGVCLDNDPNFIIMELMESGDLLSYLRSSRPQIYMSSGLTLLDLVSMCVDVAKGCRYLEEMHFVHRDLACRNCLVSSGDPQTRVVKIGDFGLARDIYKNDYYRKEGEGLLPVRWMAPESLVDGVFTCQSDVWAFGVLVWEILTLGQQPYPARTNLEVLHYVRNGGRLSRPNNCSDQLHQLMLKTWSYNPENRPTFKYCLETLEDLKSKTSPIPLAAIQYGHYVSRTPNGSSWKTGSDIESRDQVPFLQSVSESHVQSQQLTETQNTDPPHYLELLYDSDTATTASDGYEVPKHLPVLPPMPPVSTERLRSFSTSSTVSNASGSTSLSNQVSSVCSHATDNKLLESPMKVVKELKGNGIIDGITKGMDSRQNGEKDLSILEQFLTSRIKCSNSKSDKHKKDPECCSDLTYSNVSKHSRTGSQSLQNDVGSNFESKVESTKELLTPIS